MPSSETEQYNLLDKLAEEFAARRTASAVQEWEQVPRLARLTT